MKYLTPFCIAAFTCTNSLAFDELQVGLVGFVDSKPYKSVKAQAQAFPFVVAQYGIFYLNGLDMGVNIFQGENATVNVGISGGTYGYRAKDGDYLQGMRTKKPSIDGDVEATILFNKESKITVRMSHDISSKHKGYSATFQYDKELLCANKHSLVGYAKAEYLNHKKTDYYYGVSTLEATEFRGNYRAKGALNLAIGVNYMHLLSRDWSLIGGVEYVRFDEQIYKSPIVDNDVEMSGYIGFMYRFI